MAVPAGTDGNNEESFRLLGAIDARLYYSDDEGLTWRLLEAERSLEEASRLEDLDSSGLHSDRETNLRNLDMILAETGNKGKKR